MIKWQVGNKVDVERELLADRLQAPDRLLARLEGASVDVRRPTIEVFFMGFDGF